MEGLEHWLHNHVEEFRLHKRGCVDGEGRLEYQFKPPNTYFQVAESYATYEAADEGLDAARSALLAAIRERYGQEQAWGDKVRRASTW